MQKKDTHFSDDKFESVVKKYALRLAGFEGLESFNRKVREKTHAHFPTMFSKSEISILCSPEGLCDLVVPESLAYECIDIFSHNNLVRLTDILNKSDRLAVDVISEHFNTGATIRFRNLERHIPIIKLFSDSVTHCFLSATTVNAYLTPSNQNGFPPHFDNTDVFIVQILGKKKWKIFDHYSDHLILPLKDVPWDPGRFRPENNAQHIQMVPGDVLYIPRGEMHTAKSEDILSLHLTVSLEPDPVVDYLSMLMRQWASVNVRARQRVPDHQAEAKEALLELTRNFHVWLEQYLSHEESSVIKANKGKGDDILEKFFCMFETTDNQKYSE